MTRDQYLKNIKYNFRHQIHRWRRQLTHPRTWLIIAAGVALFFGIIGVLTYTVFASQLVSRESLVNAKNSGFIIYDRNQRVIYTTAGAHDVSYINFSDIPQNVKNATIAVEDKDFYSHPGFSLASIARALYVDFLSGDPTRYGASTITQQLVKNALLTPEKNFIRKYQELVLSLEVERRFTKDQIFEMYLNSVYYGSGAYGIGNAAKVYFGKDIKDLTLAEAAQLAALPVAPSFLSPQSGDKIEAKKRQELILQKMVEQGYITSDQRDAAKTAKLVIVPAKDDLSTSPHFALYVLDIVKGMLSDQGYSEDQIGRLGLRITTSLDLDLQRIAEKAVSDQVTRLAGSHVTNGGLVALDPTTGEVLAMVGSADYSNDAIGGKLNVVFADRQPGSSFKPLVYLKAFESKNYTAATLLHDTPTDFGGGYSPHDADLKYRGDILARFALANSLNIPAVEMMSKVGVTSALEMAHRLKISTLQDESRYGLSLVLGGGEVKLFELTRAYGVIANYGNYVDSTPVLKVNDKLGNELFKADPHKENLVDPQYTYIISNILSDNSARQMIFGNSLTLSHPAAVKTGTTENNRDAWTIGYTPNLVTGVWVGNNDGSYMIGIAGATGASPIWRNFMEQAEAKLGWQSFKVPAGIQSVTVCRGNGLKSHGTSGDSYKEVFALGTVPSSWCDSEYVPPPVTTPSADKKEEGRKKDEAQPIPPGAGGPGEPLPTPEPQPTPDSGSV